jgi:hypothetical protein
MEKNKIANIHFVTYSNGNNRVTGYEYAHTQNLLVDSIQLHTKYNVIYHTYNLEKIKNKDWFSKISNFPNLNFNSNFSRDGYYNAWKVFLVKEIYDLMGDDDILYYVDSSGYHPLGFTSNIDTLLEFGFENDRICGSFGFDVKNDSFKCCDNIALWQYIYGNLELNYNEFISKPHVLNSWIVFKKEVTNENFINDWAKYVTIEVKGVPLIAFHHTIDQSIFNILVYKYNFNCFFSNQYHDTNKNHNNVHSILNQEIENKNNINKFFLNPLIYTDEFRNF